MPDTGNRRIPNFFIVGAPKCGTTSLWYYLKQHSDIFMCDPKEPHFFGKDLKYESAGAIKDLNDYLALFDQVRNESKIGEASVFSLYSKSAANEIREFNPTANIIIMLRNPVDMVYSLYNFWVSTGREDIHEFQEALAAEDDRRAGLRLPDLIYHFPAELLLYRDIARYSLQVKRYLDVFGKDKVHFIIFDDFVADTANEVANVFRFLDVDETELPDLKQGNAGTVRQVRHPAIKRIVKNAFTKRLLRKLRPHPLGGGTMGFLEKLWRRHIYQYEPTKPIATQVKNNLKKEFRQEIKNLSVLIQRNLDAWL